MTTSKLIRRLLMSVAYLAAISGCSQTYNDQAADTDDKAASGTSIKTFVYECPDDYSFVARTEDSKVWLFLPGKTIDLPRVTSASGAKYTDGDILFWSKGSEAMLEAGNGRHTGCRNNPARAIWEHAKLNGADFRATGNEPGWYLEISNKRDILLVTDYGQTTYQFTSATLQAEPHAESAVYHARNERDIVEIVVTARPCRDTMSGTAYPSTVSVIVNDKRLAGCGKPLH
jgi:membrane-bound inhibitor of C-type lysozyme